MVFPNKNDHYRLIIHQCWWAIAREVFWEGYNLVVRWNVVCGRNRAFSRIIWGYLWLNCLYLLIIFSTGFSNIWHNWDLVSNFARVMILLRNKSACRLHFRYHHDDSVRYPDGYLWRRIWESLWDFYCPCMVYVIHFFGWTFSITRNRWYKQWHIAHRYQAENYQV